MPVSEIFIFLMLLVFFLDLIKRGVISVLLSPFWVFSYFFALAYPVKFQIVMAGYPIQAPLISDSAQLSNALIFSAIFWFMVYVLYVAIRSNKPYVTTGSLVQNDPFIEKKTWVVLLSTSLIAASLLFYVRLLSQVDYRLIAVFAGNAQNEARVGGGGEFFIGTLYLYGFIAYAFLGKKNWLWPAIIVSCVGISFLEMVLLTTRRPLYMMIYILLVCVVLEKHRNQKTNMFLAAVLAVFPFVGSMLVPIAQVLRYSFEAVVEDAAILNLTADDSIVAIGSTFEGIEYLARYLDVVSDTQLVFGVDYGVAYLFNAVLALIPRFIWLGKPEVYGSVAIQDFLYSSGFGVTTLPSGIVVDALFGFGLIGVCGYAFIVAGFLSWVERVLFQQIYQSSVMRAVAAFSYAWMFNLVRGGTGILQALLLVVVFLLIAKCPLSIGAKR